MSSSPTRARIDRKSCVFKRAGEPVDLHTEFRMHISGKREDQICLHAVRTPPGVRVRRKVGLIVSNERARKDMVITQSRMGVQCCCWSVIGEDREREGSKRVSSSAGPAVKEAASLYVHRVAAGGRRCRLALDQLEAVTVVEGRRNATQRSRSARPRLLLASKVPWVRERRVGDSGIRRREQGRRICPS